MKAGQLLHWIRRPLGIALIVFGLLNAALALKFFAKESPGEFAYEVTKAFAYLFNILGAYLLLGRWISSEFAALFSLPAGPRDHDSDSGAAPPNSRAPAEDLSAVLAASRIDRFRTDALRTVDERLVAFLRAFRNRLAFQRYNLQYRLTEMAQVSRPPGTWEDAGEKAGFAAAELTAAIDDGGRYLPPELVDALKAHATQLSAQQRFFDNWEFTEFILSDAATAATPKSRARSERVAPVLDEHERATESVVADIRHVIATALQSHTQEPISLAATGWLLELDSIKTRIAESVEAEPTPAPATPHLDVSVATVQLELFNESNGTSESTELVAIRVWLHIENVTAVSAEDIQLGMCGWTAWGGPRAVSGVPKYQRPSWYSYTERSPPPSLNKALRESIAADTPDFSPFSALLVRDQGHFLPEGDNGQPTRNAYPTRQTSLAPFSPRVFCRFGPFMVPRPRMGWTFRAPVYAIIGNGPTTWFEFRYRIGSLTTWPPIGRVEDARLPGARGEKPTAGLVYGSVDSLTLLTQGAAAPPSGEIMEREAIEPQSRGSAVTTPRETPATPPGPASEPKKEKE